MYTKTDDVMLDREIKKLRKLITVSFKKMDLISKKFESFEQRFKKIEKILKDEAWAEMED